jgi:hypothetical protein
MRFIVRFVVQSAALIGVVVFAIFFLGFRSDMNEQANSFPSTTLAGVPSSVVGASGKYAPVLLVGGASFNLDAVVAQRPVVFWFWAPG